MPLSPVQKGAIGQFAFLAVALATGRGQLEVYVPAADNEGRDAEVRRHLKRQSAVGVQIKVAFSLVTHEGNRNFLRLRFKSPKGHVQRDPRLYYFFAAYDPGRLQFTDPVFLIPSPDFYRLAQHGPSKHGIEFAFLANLGPRSRDHWKPYRVALRDLGKCLLAVIDDSEPMARAESQPLPADAVLIGRSTRPT